MVPVCYLLMLWQGWWGAATGAQEKLLQVVQATESHTVFLPCPFDSALVSNFLEMTWLNPSGEVLLSMSVKYHNSEVHLGSMWELIYNHSSPDNVWFTCSWNGISGRDHKPKNRTGTDDSENIQEEMEDSSEDIYSSGQQEDIHPTQSQESFSCDAPIPSNWTHGTLLWIQHNSLAQKTVLMNVTIQRSPHNLLYVRPNAITLILPSVTFKDAGNYTCQWKNQERLFQLEVKAKAGMAQTFWLQFLHQHWIIWSVTLGYVTVCLSFLLCFLQLRRSFHIRKQQMKKRDPIKRRYFHAQRKKPHISNGILALQANEDGTEQVDVFSYENVQPSKKAKSGQQLLQKGKILPNTTDMDDEEYECPDSETELKSDDDDNYENTQEEVKQGNAVLNDASIYANSKDKIKSGSHKWDSAALLYANNSQEALKNPAQDPFDEDGENYENVEEEPHVSPGAARLIAGLRLQLALDPPVDRQDGGSEASTGSQSYEEMNGSLCATESEALHLQPNTSNEEDADSYENMESPNSLSSRKECNLDPQGYGPAFGSIW